MVRAFLFSRKISGCFSTAFAGRQSASGILPEDQTE